jgi:DNA-directed RNA polymerase subunit beta'
MGEIEHALNAKAVSLHAKIKARFVTKDADGNEVIEVHETTPGRMLIGQYLPRSPEVPFSTVNQLMTKKAISSMIDTVYRALRPERDRDLLRPDHVAEAFGHACLAPAFPSARTTWSSRTTKSEASSTRRPAAREGIRAAIQ